MNKDAVGRFAPRTFFLGLRKRKRKVGLAKSKLKATKKQKKKAQKGRVAPEQNVNKKACLKLSSTAVAGQLLEIT